MEFSICARVIVKSLNRKGFVKGIRFYYDVHNLKTISEYEIRLDIDEYRDEYLVQKHIYCQEFLGYKTTFVKVLEDDLELDCSDIEKIRQQFHDSIKNLNGSFRVPVIDNQECAHSWQTYEGLMKKYDFCTLCDKKRG